MPSSPGRSRPGARSWHRLMTGSAPRRRRPARLAALRAELQRRGLDGFVVPRADEHQGEYVPRALAAPGLAHRLHRLGRAGHRAGRPRGDLHRRPLHAAGARPGRHRRLRCRTRSRGVAAEPGSPRTCPRAAGSAIDPWLHTVDGHRALRAAPASAPAASFVPVDANPLDARVARPAAGAAGAGAAASRRVRRREPAPPSARASAGIVEAKGADVALLTAPDSIAWLLNVRGGDVPRTPFPLGFALLHGDGHVDLFMDRRKVPDRTLGLARQRRDAGAARGARPPPSTRWARWTSGC